MLDEIADDKRGFSAAGIPGGFSVQERQGPYWGSRISEVFLEQHKGLLSGMGLQGSSRLCEIKMYADGFVDIGRPSPVGVFADPNVGGPCVAIGLNTYKMIKA